MRVRLSLLMFCEYFVLGAYVPVMTLYLKNHAGLTGGQMGIILSLASAVAFISPMIGAVVADRIVSSERLFALCHLMGGGLMLLLLDSAGFYSIAAAYFFYSLCIGPTIALSNSITFQHGGDRSRFGNIRLWGTVGWIGAAFVVWGIFHVISSQKNSSSAPLLLSSVSSFVLSLYALTLPVSKLERHRYRGGLLPVEAFTVFRDRKIFMISFTSLLIVVVDKYYYFGMAPFLSESGFTESEIFPLMSVGQVTEVIVMLYLSLFLGKFGFKNMLIFGIISEITRFFFFIFFKDSVAGILAGIGFHGLAYAFFFTSVYVYIDSHCKEYYRAGVHQIFSLVTSGFGTLIANITAGFAMDLYVIKNSKPDFTSFWLIPVSLSVFALVTFTAISRKDKFIYRCD